MADNIEYRLMAEEDRDELHLLLTESFIKDEPTAKALNLDIFEENTNDWIRQQVEDCKETILSIVAVETATGKVIGVILAYVTNRERNAPLVLPSGNAPKNLVMYVKFFLDLHEDVDLFDTYDCDEYVYFTTLSVREEYRRRGIASQLVEEATSKGRELGYRVFVADATSNYSTRLFEKLEYDVLEVKRYDEYKDENGDAIFRDTGEHQEAKLIAKFYN